MNPKSLAVAGVREITWTCSLTAGHDHQREMKDAGLALVFEL
jgi:hypothetical protein